MNNILEVSNLRVAFQIGSTRSVPVRNVSFTVGQGQRVALVGESGCGKSLTALAIGGLIDRAQISGNIYRPRNLRIAYIFQNPMESLNPTMRVGAQIAEAMPQDSKDTPEDLLAAVGLPREAAKKYPCEMSGGQQQRAMIAMGLAQRPGLLVADEPTTALDVTTQREVLDLVRKLADERDMAVLFITHNLGLVAEYSDYVHVMYAGSIVESGEVAQVLAEPHHPYTKGLLAAVPSLAAPRDAPLVGIPGTVPQPTNWPQGCAFHPRCPVKRASCALPSWRKCPEMP